MMEITKIWLTPTEIWVQTADGRQASERFADYAALRDASPTEREQYTLSPFGIHWDAPGRGFVLRGLLPPHCCGIASISRENLSAGTSIRDAPGGFV